MSEEVIEKKDNFSKKFVKAFMPSNKSFGDYILQEVVVPILKRGIIELANTTANLIRDSFVNGCSELLGVERPNQVKRDIPKVSYNRIYSDLGKDPIPAISTTTTTTLVGQRYYIEDLEFDSQEEAQRVLETMEEIISAYGMVSVPDLYESAGMEVPPYTSNRYGWRNVTGATVKMGINGKYILRMPRLALL